MADREQDDDAMDAGSSFQRDKRPQRHRQRTTAEADYEVGYGRPPKYTRFQPGQSGNPKGRPKGAENLATMLERELNQVVEVREGGRKRKLTKRQVMARQIVNKAMQGDLKAIELVRQNHPKFGGGLPEPTMASGDEARHADEEAVLATFVQQILFGQAHIVADQEEQPADAGEGP